jgi:VWFA-related protein
MATDYFKIRNGTTGIQNEPTPAERNPIIKERLMSHGMLVSNDWFVYMRNIGLPVVFLLIPLAVFAQKESQRPKYDVHVNLVSLDVEVLDRVGNHVWGLTKSDFIVEENGTPMEISNFALSADRPVSLAAVLDTSALSVDQLIVCKAFLRTIAHGLDRSDELCLYSFNSQRVYFEQDFTSAMKPLWDALDNIGVPSRQSDGLLLAMFGATPPTGLAIDLALHKLEGAHNGKKALLLISNRFNGTGPATVEHIQRSGCTLLTLAFPHKASMVLQSGDAISTHQLIRESGGRRFSVESQNMEGICRQMMYSLKNYYSIGYLAKVQSGDTKPRKIRIRIPQHSYKINFRRTYIPSAAQK